MVEMSLLLNTSTRKLVNDEPESKCPAICKSSTHSSKETRTVSFIWREEGQTQRD